MKRQFVLGLAALALAAPMAVSPVAATAQDAPSYADSGYQTGSQDEQIRGRIVSFDGGYQLAVRDERGYIDNVELHQGTIINPTGLTLEPGMVVSILGYNTGPVLAANEIDTPYTFAGGGVPYYSGRPWNYYGPTVGLSFFFNGGGGGWWHGNAFGGQPFAYNRGARVYDNVHVRNVYRNGGQFQGHTYVAPRQNGGYYAPANRRYTQGLQHGQIGGGQHGPGGGHAGGGHPGGNHSGGGHPGGGHPGGESHGAGHF